MRRDAVSGTLLITGAMASLLVMSLHPTAHGLMNAESAERLARLNVLVHGLALVSVPVLFLGLLGFSRRLGPTSLTAAALVAYGFGCAAVMSAAVASGFVATEVIKLLITADSSSRELYHGLLRYTGLLNQGFAKVHLVATSAAILLWSAAILKTRRASRGAGVAGIVIGVGILAAFFSGLLRLDVHGFGIMIFAQSCWLIWVGILMFRGEERGAGSLSPTGLTGIPGG